MLNFDNRQQTNNDTLAHTHKHTLSHTHKESPRTNGDSVAVYSPKVHNRLEK